MTTHAETFIKDSERGKRGEYIFCSAFKDQNWNLIPYAEERGDVETFSTNELFPGARKEAKKSITAEIKLDEQVFDYSNVFLEIQTFVDGVPRPGGPYRAKEENVDFHIHIDPARPNDPARPKIYIVRLDDRLFNWLESGGFKIKSIRSSLNRRGVTASGFVAPVEEFEKIVDWVFTYDKDYNRTQIK